MASPSCFVVSLIAAVLSVTSCYPSGAPELACPALDPTPCHGGTTATGSPPFKLTVSSKTYKPKQNVSVSLSGIGSAQYRGFLIEGRLSTGNSTDSVGYFYNTTTAKNVCSYSKNGIGITQMDSHPRSVEKFIWRAPNQVMGNIIFIYTVVRGNADDASDFFHGIKSPPLTPAGSSSAHVTIV